jgi:predicted transposase YbfD/YdcC
VIQAVETTIVDHFIELEDPRVDRTKLHQLLDIITIAICAVICGADGWTGIEKFGKAKERWLRSFLALPNGIPSHDTFGRVFARLDPEAFQRCFMRWVQAIHEYTGGQVVAIDGKCLRRSHDQRLGKEAIHMVSAWATQDHLVLGQRKVATKSNEITAIPELLKWLELTGCIVTIDAMGCQKTIAEQIRSQQGDYVLALKDNHPHLYEDVHNLFCWADNLGFAEIAHDTDHQVNKDHGRIEIRECWTISDPEYIAMVDDEGEWEDLSTVIRVRAERRIGSDSSQETRYYLSSLPPDTPNLAQRALAAVRKHWGIENGLHWVLDIGFREDDSRIRQGYAAENMAVLRHIALNLLKQETSERIGIKNKRKLAGWDNNYLMKVLSV